ncbi:MAG: hypothetical protein ACRC0M_00550 [Legionella sp.]
MTMELNKLSESRLGTLQELKLNKQQLDFSVGQILNAAVKTVYSNHEVAQLLAFIYHLQGKKPGDARSSSNDKANGNK